MVLFIMLLVLVLEAVMLGCIISVKRSLVGVAFYFNLTVKVISLVLIIWFIYRVANYGHVY